MPNPSLRELLSVASDAAYIAGRRTLAYFNAEVAVEHKADDTPVTRADREAELVIRERISRFFPDHSIVGEEHGETRGNPDYKWIIDPIDGTKSFIHGVPLYGVLIGVEVRGRASVGVIYAPGTDELVAAADGLGCTWNGRTCRVSQVSKLEDATVLAGSITRAIARVMLPASTVASSIRDTCDTRHVRPFQLHPSPSAAATNSSVPGA